MSIFDRIILLLTGLTAIYMLLHFFKRYQKEKGLHDIYYMLGFGVLLVSGLLLIFFGWDILASPYVLTVATLIPLGISMGLMNQFMPAYKKAYAWFALVGLLAIAVTSIGGLLAKPAFNRVSKHVDPFEIGGAPLLGVDGVVIVGHGRSNALAIKNAIRQARQTVEGEVVEAIRANLGS